MGSSGRRLSAYQILCNSMHFVSAVIKLESFTFLRENKCMCRKTTKMTEDDVRGYESTDQICQ